MHAATATDFAGGWVTEKVAVPGISDETTTYIACLGWHSVEAHLAFRETKLFKEHEHLLDQAEDLKHLHMVHISATQVDRDGQF